MCTAELLNEAALQIEQQAEALASAHSLDGRWLFLEAADRCAFDEYQRQVDLVNRLRLAAGGAYV